MENKLEISKPMQSRAPVRSADTAVVRAIRHEDEIRHGVNNPNRTNKPAVKRTGESVPAHTHAGNRTQHSGTPSKAHVKAASKEQEKTREKSRVVPLVIMFFIAALTLALYLGIGYYKTETDKINVTLRLPEGEGIEVMPETKKQLKIERGRQYSRVYAHTAYQMLKLYGIPALLWFGGMGLIVGGHTELRAMNKNLAADILAGNKLLQEYRGRVAKAVGEETEQKIYMGAQEGMVKVLEEDPESGEKKIVEKKADVFVDQPGSIFALNFTNETSDAFDVRAFADFYLDARVDRINKDLDLGIARAYNALDIYRMLGFNENAFGDNDEVLKRMMSYGISGNARKVPDVKMRKLEVTRLEGYQKRWDVGANCEIYVPCVRLDFNFYPLEGKI